ncbi:DNA double-strand break repair nuclease NurA [Methanoculleus sp. FWC-SCC3]|uniref:DNA double-strand break repair nuclease NurA n=1 Tax=Methanoculleus methanifontis TaxID=2584086 RepID=A0ABT8M4V9_9EURY|nr:DNA double-strand break repair nuclease NurA [Methanoculleus sp. FWC-SCC3]MDN7013605.1 DNA double-strand break repair nuclease NurA [Methanoculleus sp. FWC-SCC3]
MTDPKTVYRDAIRRIAGRIRECAPPDLPGRFAAAGGFNTSSYRRCPSRFDGAVCAVDGSNTVILDAGSFAVAAIRASISSYAGGSRLHHRTTPLQIVTVNPGRGNEDFDEIYHDCFHCTPKVHLDHDDPVRNTAVIRDTLEFWAAMEMAAELDAGDLIVLDGTLQVRHASHDEVVEKLLNLCNLRGVLIAAVTKRTSLTWGGGHPIVPAAEGLARDLGVPGPWYLCVSAADGLIDRRETRTWKQRGEQYVARLHPRAERAFKVEIPTFYSAEKVERVFSALAAYADDGRVAGYPYPLLDAHLTTKIGKDAVDQVRQDIIRDMDRLGMSLVDYTGIFGDYHDEFDRY